MKEPKTFLVGYTNPELKGIENYLQYTEQYDFWNDWNEGIAQGNNAGECLVSMFAKLCYKSLVPGKNKNITKTRDIKSNLKSVLDSGHGSVFEHVWLNFITTDCSRVFTHELVRHRVGTAFSQTSGRYCAIDGDMDIVFPIDQVAEEKKESVVVKLNRLKQEIIETAQALQKELIPENSDFAFKKKWTSAIRRIAPNGQTNEIAWSVNLRALRHTIEMRTSRHAEWEIRLVFNQVADLVKDKWPTILWGAEIEEVDGMNEYSNLKV